VNIKTLPIYLSWVRYLSFHYYSYKIAMSNEFTGRTFSTCSSDNSGCVSTYGNAILQVQGIAPDDYSSNWPAVFAICLIYHAVALILLNILKFPPTGVAGGSINVQNEENDVDNTGDMSPNETAIDIDRSLVFGDIEMNESWISFKSRESYNRMLIDDDVNYMSMKMANSLFKPPPSIVISISDLTVAVTVYTTAAANSNSIGSETKDEHNSNVDVNVKENRIEREEDFRKESNSINESNMDLDIASLAIGDDASTTFYVDVELNSTHFDKNISIHETPSLEKSNGKSTLKTQQSRLNLRKTLLSNVSAEIRPGRLVALMGGSGSGNSFPIVFGDADSK